MKPPHLKPFKGYWYIYWYDPSVKYTRRESTGIKGTPSNKPLANLKLKEFTKNLSSKTLANLITRSGESSAPLLSVSLHEYFKLRSITNASTKSIYQMAIKKFTDCLGDLPVNQYGYKNYLHFKNWMKERGFAQNTQSIWTRHLAALWRYFISPDPDNPEIQYCRYNIIKPVPEVRKPPQKLPDDIVKNIKKYFNNKIKGPAIPDYRKAQAQQQLDFIMLALNTGARQSTLLALRIEHIKWNEGMIDMTNVKIQEKIYQFPITNVVKEILIRRIGNRKSGKIFTYKNRNSLGFWKRMMNEFSVKYGMHKTKATFITNVLETGKIDILELSDITNTDPRTLKRYYRQVNIKKTGAKLNKISSSNSSSRKSSD